MAKSDNVKNKEVEKKQPKKIEPIKKPYTARVNKNIGSDANGNVRKKLIQGQTILLTKEEAENYKKHNLIF